MSYFHDCIKCRVCPNCHLKSCTTNLDVQEIVENGHIVRICPFCNSIIEKIKTLEQIMLEEKEK